MNNIESSKNIANIVLVGSVLTLSCALSACGENNLLATNGVGSGGSGFTNVGSISSGLSSTNSCVTASTGSTLTGSSISSISSGLCLPNSAISTASTTSTVSSVSTTSSGLSLTPVTAQTATTTIQPGSSLTLTTTSVVTLPSPTPNNYFTTTATLPNGSSDPDPIQGTYYVQAGTTINLPANAPTPAYVAPFTIQTQIGTLAAQSTAQIFYTDAGLTQTASESSHITFDSTGNLYISEYGYINKISPTGVATSIFNLTPPYPQGIAVDASNNVYIGQSFPEQYGAGSSAYITQLQPNGSHTIFSAAWEAQPMGLTTGDSLYGQGGMAFDQLGTLYHADLDNNRIVKFNATGAMSVVAGTGTSGNADGTGNVATFISPADLAIDSHNNIYVRSGDHIRKITPDGTTTTLVSGLPNGSNVQSLGWGPLGSDAIAIDPANNVYVAGIQVFYRIDPQGNVTTYPMPSGKFAFYAFAEDGAGHLYALDFDGVQYEVVKLSF